MSIQHTVYHVEKSTTSLRPCWLVSIRAPSGECVVHMFPTDTGHWRAAEYGIDPQDARTLLDVVLHERFMDPDEFGPDSDTFVYNTDPATARAAHLARLAHVQARSPITDPDNLLQPVIEHHLSMFDPSAHRERTESARQTRARSIGARFNG